MTGTDYLKDEVRNGFYIPTAIKQAWAAELDVLTAVDELCARHGIRYFADWGTLLGTVRHAGFVPWDDDLDICMKREDYIRFRKYAGELPEGFKVFDYTNHDDHWHFITRVANTEFMCFTEEHLNKYYNFPYIASIDIFLLDYLYKDPAKEKERCDEVLRLLSLADMIVEGRLSGDAALRELKKAADKYHTDIKLCPDPVETGRALYALAEAQMSRVPENEAEELGQIFPWIIKGGRGFDKRAYDRAVYLPYEDRRISVPWEYASMLKRRYGDYFVIRKVWGGHDYPFFEGQRRALEEAAGEALPAFRFTQDLLKRTPADEESSLKAIAEEWAAALKDTYTDILSAAAEDIPELLAAAQELAVDLGTLTEEVYGEEKAAVFTQALQIYCESIYDIHEKVAGGSMSAAMAYEAARDASDKLIEKIDAGLMQCREILFITTGAEEWKSFAPIYEELKKDIQISVIAMPLYRKDALGRLKEKEHTDPLKGLPPGLPLTEWDKYPLLLRRPERIYIQFPYDNENPCLGMPEGFSLRELQAATPELVYVQPFVTGDFSAEDRNDIYNMKHYVTAPAVVMSDRILVPSENMRQRYIERLTAFAGEDSRSCWEGKTEVLSYGDRVKISPSAEKRLLFCIGLNELTELGEGFFPALESRLQVFKQNAGSISTELMLYPAEKDMWMAADPVLAEKLFKLTGGMKAACDTGQHAYYGSPSPFVLEFSQSGRPVMIADFKLDT